MNTKLIADGNTMKKFVAYIIESESGWGSKVDETLEFNTAEERDAFVREYNAKHNPNLGVIGHPVPAWYMVAKRAED